MGDIIDAGEKFDLKANQKAEKNKKEQEEWGAWAWKKLEKTLKLTLTDREKLARNLGLYMDRKGIQAARLPKFQGESKEIYRLTLKPNEQMSDKNRLRASSRDYKKLIKALAECAGEPLESVANHALLGTSLHPVNDTDVNEFDKIFMALDSVVNLLDQEFGLLEKFRSIAQQRIRQFESKLQQWRQQWDNDNDYDFVYEVAIDIISEGYWRDDDDDGSSVCSARSSGYYWYEIIPFLPHVYLGMDQEFDGDVDYWPLLENNDETINEAKEAGDLGGSYLIEYGKEKSDIVKKIRFQRRRKFQEIFKPDKPLRFDLCETKELPQDIICNYGTPQEIERKLQEFYYYSETLKEFHENENDSSASSYPIHFWLAVYPDTNLKRLQPVLINSYISVYLEAVTPSMLMTTVNKSRLIRWNYDSETLIYDSQALLDRIKEVLGLSESQDALQGECELIREWRRTASFVEYNPILRQSLREQERHKTLWSNLNQWQQDLNDSKKS